MLSYKMPERPQVADPDRHQGTQAAARAGGRDPHRARHRRRPVVVHVPGPAKAAAAAAAAPPPGLGFWPRLVYLFTGKAPGWGRCRTGAGS